MLQRPFDDYVLTDNNTRIKFFVNISGQDTFHIRSIEYVSPSVGTGAEAVTRVGTNGEIDAITIKNGGSGYRLNFAPKVSISLLLEKDLVLLQGLWSTVLRTLN